MDTFELDIKQAQKLVLLQQHYATGYRPSKKSSALLACIEQLSYVQIDTISVVARAHHHILHSRIKLYSEADLAALQKNGSVFEYWSHAAAYLPMSQYRYSLVRKQAYKNGDEHWYKKDPKVMSEVLARITDTGPLMAKDFQQVQPNKKGWWDWKPAKIALEQLFMQGDLMVVERRGFQKVYDLTERVIPIGTDTSVPSNAELCRHLILQYLKAHGLARAEHIAYLRKGLKRHIQAQLQVLREQGVIVAVKVADQHYYALANFPELLKQRLPQQVLKILSPFDNLLIQRARMRELFDFNYQIECYVPAAKRIYGYFTLPLLLGQRFVGRMDVKVHRKQQHMSILHLHLETPQLDALQQPLAEALQAFMLFQQAQSIAIERLSHVDKHISDASLQRFKKGVLQNLITSTNPRLI